MIAAPSLRIRGFTLLELSIVLVIIGLIVGSILVGRDLYIAARDRSVIKEFNQYQQAVQAFNQKYDALPGDMTNPATFWPNQIANNNNAGNGNGIVVWGYEGPMAWYELQLAGLISAGNISIACTFDCLATPGVNEPRSSTIPNAGWTIGVNNQTGTNVFFFGAKPTGGSHHNTLPAITPVLSPSETWYIDSKIDDGMPTTGSLLVRNFNSAVYLPCYSGNQYILNGANSNAVACAFDIAIGQ